MDGQTDRHTDKLKDGQTGRQTGIQAAELEAIDRRINLHHCSSFRSSSSGSNWLQTLAGFVYAGVGKELSVSQVVRLCGWISGQSVEKDESSALNRGGSRVQDRRRRVGARDASLPTHAAALSCPVGIVSLASTDRFQCSHGVYLYVRLTCELRVVITHLHNTLCIGSTD